MLHKTKTGKALALLLAAVMLFAGIPFSTSAEGDGTEFQSENLFQTHLESKHEAVYYPWNNGELKDEENGGYKDMARFDSRGALDGSVDGNLDTS